MGVLGHDWEKYFPRGVSELRGIGRVKGLDKDYAELGIEAGSRAKFPNWEKLPKFLCHLSRFVAVITAP